MNLLLAALAFLLAVFFALAGITRAGVWWIERRNPPVGSFLDIDGTRLHFVHVPAGPNADLPPIVFLHGASANLNDQMVPLRPLLEGRAELLFVDRPGHGWSQRGSGNETPRAQARTVAKLMDRLGIRKAVIVGHSFGGAATAVFGAEMGDRVTGLVFLSAATHPWPGAGTAWYYKLTATPVLGWLFSETLALPAGLSRMRPAAECVFSPNALRETYLNEAEIPLVLRPSAFRANARDVQGLYDFVLAEQPRYSGIKAPAVVVTGDRDTVVYEEIHSRGLTRDIAGSELVWVKNLGHKPDWIARDLVVAAVEKVSGLPRDLQSIARSVEARIATDAFATDQCAAADAPSGDATGELAPQ